MNYEAPRSLFVATAALSVSAFLVLGCNPSKGAFSEARKVSEQLAGAERASACFRANEGLEVAKEAAPFVLENKDGACQMKAKNTPEGKDLPASLSLLLAPMRLGEEGCKELEAKFKEGYAEWEKEQDFIVALECDKKGKPTKELAAAHKLEALFDSFKLGAASLPNDPAKPALASCVSGVESHLADMRETVQKLRCEVLKEEAEIDGMTSGRLLGRLHQTVRELDPSGSKLKPFNESVDKAISGGKDDEIKSAKKRLESETMSLITDQKEKLCGKAEPSDPKQDAERLGAAVGLCTSAGGGVPEKGSRKSGMERERRALEELQEGRGRPMPPPPPPPPPPPALPSASPFDH